ncbi:MAG: DUF4401 domain-containing protein [Pseudomonadota bacterium]
MSDAPAPWYVRWVVGIGAWITAIIMMLLAGAIVYTGFDFDGTFVLSVIGALYLGFGIWLLRQADRGVFLHQLAIATVAAGAGLVAGGIAVEAEELWVGFVISIPLCALLHQRRCEIKDYHRCNQKLQNATRCRPGDERPKRN